MKNYECKNWLMNDIAHALKGEDEQGRHIIIPVFQRGKRWNQDKRDAFIDSLLKGYPVGTLLFAEQANKTFSVIDGLQRSSTICEYILNPTRRENLKNVDHHILLACREAIFPGNENETICPKINEIILSYISNYTSYDEIEATGIAMHLLDNIPSNEDYKPTLTKLSHILKPWFQDYKRDFENIKQTEIPVIVYTGRNELLNDIFTRINKSGEPLNDYEIYAATWDTKKYTINDPDIVENVIKKYNVLTKDDYTIDTFNSDAMRKSKKLSAFEFLFGFGKKLVTQFPFLNLDSKGQKDDEVISLGFELVDVCINDSKNICNLADIIRDRAIKLNDLNRKICEAAQFVSNALSSIFAFKGNQRNQNQYLHPKYFILALIAFTFREMYDINDMEKKRDTWNNISTIVSKRILEHYIFELVKNDWHDGGAGKMYSSVKEKTFMEEYQQSMWENLLNNYFNEGLLLRQTKKFSSPSNTDKLLLNCIYTDVFTVNDNAANKLYDIEHLATKEWMKKLIKTTNCTKGLPVSHIANLCYLPESLNRKKKNKTIYEDPALTQNLSEIENKYSFTQATDFDFLYLPYESRDSSDLEKMYLNFLSSRFSQQKQKILKFLGYGTSK